MNIASQATRIITENRIAVVKVHEHSVLVQVREGPTVRVVRFHRGHWSCTCTARRCAHLIAAQRLIVTEGLQLSLVAGEAW